jgi:hypothetical protein
MHRLDREDLLVPSRLLVLLGLRVLLILSVQVVLRLLAALEVQLGPADLVDQNKMQAQGSAWQPQDTWPSFALPPLRYTDLRYYAQRAQHISSINYILVQHNRV